MRSFYSLCALLLILCGSGFAAPSARDLAEAKAWFKQFPWPDLTGKPYVEILDQDGEVDARGFLLSEDHQSWEILADGFPLDMDDLLSGAGSRFATDRVPKSKSEHLRKLRMKSLHEVVAEACLGKDGGNAPRGLADLFALARYCEMAGANDLAQKLDHALPDDPKPLKQRIAEEMEQALLSNAAYELQNGTSRDKVLNKFVSIAKYFPNSVDARKTQDYIRVLREMVAEDLAHTKAAARPISAMTPEEKVREYIFQLREQTGASMSFKTPCDIFFARDDTPAHKLASLGLVAVPALLETLSDERLTRTVGMPRMRTAAFVWTNADCAEAILSRIAGRDFFHSDSDAAEDRKKQLAEVRQRANAWMREAQTRGEYALLVEGIRSGAHDSERQADLLMAINPEKALEVIEERLGGLEDAGAAQPLILVAVNNRTPATTALLKRVLKQGRYFSLRVLVGGELFRRKDPGAVPAMIEEWKAWKPEEEKFDFRNHDHKDPRELIELLAGADSVEAANTLVARAGEVPCEVRCDILRAMTSNFAFDQPMSREVSRIHETAMIKALDDHAVYRCSGNQDDIAYEDPRVCDLAAIGLFTRWPLKYPLRWRVTRVERDAEIAKLRNIWRKENKIPELPISAREVHPQAVAEPNTVAGIRWKESMELPFKVGEKLTPHALAETLALLRDESAGWTDIYIAIERPQDRKGIVIAIETAKTDVKGEDWNREVTVINGPGERFQFPNREDDEHPEMILEGLLKMEGSRPFCLYVHDELQSQSD